MRCTIFRPEPNCTDMSLKAFHLIFVTMLTTLSFGFTAWAFVNGHPLFGVAGAVLARFSSLQAGLLSNVGTGLIYARHARGLDRLVASVERQRALLVAAVQR